MGLRTTCEPDTAAADVEVNERERRQNDGEMTTIAFVGIAGIVAAFAIGYVAFGVWGLLFAGAVIFIASAAWHIATGTG